MFLFLKLSLSKRSTTQYKQLMSETTVVDAKVDENGTYFPEYNITYFDFDKNIKGPYKIEMENINTVALFYGFAKAYRFTFVFTDSFVGVDAFGSNFYTKTESLTQVPTEGISNWVLQTNTERATIIKKNHIVFISVSFPIIALFLIIIPFIHIF